MLDRVLETTLRLTHNAVVQRTQKMRKTSQKPPPTGSKDAGVYLGNTIPSARTGAAAESVYVQFPTRLRQSFFTGLPGSGKSTALRTFMLDDLERGNGIVQLDWQGESTDLMLAFLAERYSLDEILPRLRLLDLRSQSAFGELHEPVFGFNPTAPLAGDPYTTVAQFKNILRQKFGDAALGVQLINDLEYALLALALSPAGPFSLTDIERLFVDPEFRATVLAGVSDEVVLRFFEQFAQVKDPMSRVVPLANKISPFYLSSLRLREMVTKTENLYSFDADFAQVDKPIVLICTAADELGSTVAGTIAGLLLNAAISATMRADRLIAGEPETGVHFVLDEAPEYASAIEEPLSKLLRIGRKFGAFASVVCQSPNSFSPSIRSLLIDIAATKLFFGQGPQQADHLAGWISDDAMPKAVLRATLMQAQPGEALMLRPGQAPCRVMTHMAPYPKVGEEKVRALRRAALARWGKSTSVDSSGSTPSPTPPATSEPMPELIEAREVDTPDETVETPKPSRRRKKK